MTRLGRYELVRPLGVGGQGTVHRAILRGPAGFRKDVAVKVLQGGGEGLRREARLGGLLRHPNIVDVYEVGEDDGTWFCAMELCRGGSLSALAPLPPRAVVDVGLAVCAALDYAHRELGLVHLDLKPANLLLDGGTVKVADLGIARAFGFDDDCVRGTPGFMAPELLAGEPVDARADIYALGVVLHVLATGSDLHEAETRIPGECEVGPVSAVGALALVLERMLAREPSRRFGSMAEVADALRALGVEGDGLVELVQPVAIEPSGTRTNLWPDPGGFFGRQTAIEQLLWALEEPGIRVLKGPGGIGKTRLARCTAVAYREQTGAGAWFCDLSAANGPIEAARAIADVLGVVLGPGEPEALVDQLGHALAARGEAILVLDTCERLVGAADLVRRLVERAPDARILLTSRTVPSPGFEVIDVPPLSTSAARDLLAHLALERGYDVGGDPALVALADRLDGVPLALELAASRIGVLAPSEVLDRLHPAWLRSGSAETSERQATLRATLDWSWDLLEARERSALAQLSVFAGAFDPTAAEAVLELEGDPFVLDVLQALCNHSWLSWEGGRLRMLASAREYAAERLDDPTVAHERHGRWFAGRLDRGGPIVRPSRCEPNHRRELQLEVDDLVLATRRAVARGDARTAFDACRGAWEVLQATGPLQLSLELTRSVADLVDLSPSESVRIAVMRGRSAELLGHLDEARAVLERALAEHEPTGLYRADVLSGLGRCATCENDLERAAALHGRAGELFRAAMDSQGQGVSAVNRAQVSWRQGKPDQARALFHEALVQMRAAGNRRGRAEALISLSMLLYYQGELEACRDCTTEALEVYRALGDRRGEAVALGNLGALYSSTGRRGDARDACEQALALHRQVGNRLFEGQVLGNLARLVQEERGPVAAIPLLEAVVQIFRERSDARFEAVHLSLLAVGIAERDGMSAAEPLFDRAESLLAPDSLDRVQVLTDRATALIRAGLREQGRAALDRACVLLERAGAGPDSPLAAAVGEVQAILDG